MRIIAGQAKGRRLFAPGGRQSREQLIRPTSDRARESLFSILGFERIRGSRVLDLFAGTGALGIEALSRGAGGAVFVDKSSEAIDLIKKNITLCGFSDKTHVYKRDLLKGLFFLQEEKRPPQNDQAAISVVSEGEAEAYDLVFLDPPYRKQLSEKLVAELVNRGLLRHNSMVVCEESSSESLPDSICGLSLSDQRRYGDTGFWFYSKDG